MKYFFMFLGVLGAILLIGMATLLFVGVPSNQKEVVKVIDVRR